MNSKKISVVCLLALALLSATAARAQSNCQPPAPSFAPGQNVFTDEQEVDLGDAIAEQLQRTFRVVEDAELTSHLSRIGARLIKHLPPTRLRFQFFLVELPEANAFVLPGGRIYVSRKLVAFAADEDELASVIAHEIGHLVARQQSLEMTRRLREVLGVTAVGDRRDVFDKYNQLVENAARKPKSFERRGQHEDKDQIAADQIGLFALAAAGYDPQAFVRFFDRLTETKGKKGNFFSDLFGLTSPDSKRLREMIQSVSALPPACKDARQAASGEAFQTWQAAVLNYTRLERKEALHAVKTKTRLAPPLRGEVTHLRFSPDGKYVLAQDDAGINVLTREPFEFRFRIEAPEAYKAYFSPDSQSVFVYNADLRVEEWDVGGQKLKGAHEIVTRKKCLQTALAPDGRTLACLDDDLGLNLFEVASSAPVYQKKSFYQPNPLELLMLSLLRLLDGDELSDREFNFVNLGFSSDGRYFAAGQRGLIVNELMVAATNSAVAVDLTTRKEVSLKEPSRKLLAGGFSFVGPERLIGINRAEPAKSGIVALPGGAVAETMPMFVGKPEAVSHGNYMLIRPFDKYPVGVMDLKKSQVFLVNRQTALDVYDDVFVAERITGELGLYRTGKNELLAKLNLPSNSLGRLRAVALSPDFRYLAVSERTRGGVWDLTKGERTHLVRGFRGGHFAEDRMLYADFPKFENFERAMGKIDPARREAFDGPKIKEERVRQYGRFVIQLKPGKKEGGSREDVVLEALDARTLSPLWSKPFPNGLPRYFVDDSNETLVLAWAAASKEAQAEIKNDPTLRARLGSPKEREGDYLLQVLDARDGKLRGSLLVETGRGSFRISHAFAAGESVIVSDTQNRVLTYSLQTGEPQGKVFGGRAAASRAGNLLSVENERGQLTLYHLTTLEKRDSFTFAHPVALARFSADGHSLFVLTADQTAYVLDVSAAASPSK